MSTPSTLRKYLKLMANLTHKYHFLPCQAYTQSLSRVYERELRDFFEAVKQKTMTKGVRSKWWFDLYSQQSSRDVCVFGVGNGGGGGEEGGGWREYTGRNLEWISWSLGVGEGEFENELHSSLQCSLQFYTVTFRRLDIKGGMLRPCGPFKHVKKFFVDKM